jgi:hypothetical protein
MNLILRAGRHLVRVVDGAIEKAVAASVEWNTVRMDLLTHYK